MLLNVVNFSANELKVPNHVCTLVQIRHCLNEVSNYETEEII